MISIFDYVYCFSQKSHFIKRGDDRSSVLKAISFKSRYKYPEIYKRIHFKWDLPVWRENCSNSSGEAFKNKKNIEISNCYKINKKERRREGRIEKETWREWPNTLGLSARSKIERILITDWLRKYRAINLAESSWRIRDLKKKKKRKVHGIRNNLFSKFLMILLNYNRRAQSIIRWVEQNDTLKFLKQFFKIIDLIYHFLKLNKF